MLSASLFFQIAYVVNYNQGLGGSPYDPYTR